MRLCDQWSLSLGAFDSLLCLFSGDGRRDGNLGALPKTWGAHQVQEDAASGFIGFIHFQNTGTQKG